MHGYVVDKEILAIKHFYIILDYDILGLDDKVH